MDLGARIRRARETRGLTQAELASLVGVSNTTVRNWESGNFSPRNKTGKLEEVLHVDLSDPDPDGDDVSLRKASNAQLTGEVSARLAIAEARIHELEARLSAAGLGDADILSGPWAARPRPAPEPPSAPEGDTDED